MNSVLTNLISKLKDTISNLKDADTLLTKISKTSDMTKTELKELGNTSYDTASKYGKTASAYLSSAEAMAKAHTENIKAMSELSLLAQSAGDISSNVADDYLIAANAAYHLKSNIEYLTAILDGQYSIASNAAISLEDMATATSKAASVATQYGVTMEELSSLIAVAAAKTGESGSEIGNSLATVFENLQDINNSSVTKLFDSINISMTVMENGTERLKTPIELLKELSELYTSLGNTPALREDILTNIGGKYNSSTLSAILSDWSSYEEMLTLYSNGSGSAFQGAEKSATSLEGALARLNNTWDDTVENIMSSDELTTAANSLNHLLKAANNITGVLGPFGSATTIASGILGAKGLGLT